MIQSHFNSILFLSPCNCDISTLLHAVVRAAISFQFTVFLEIYNCDMSQPLHIVVCCNTILAAFAYFGVCCNAYTGVRRSRHSQFTSIYFSSSMHSGILLFSCTASIHFPHIVMPAALAYCKVYCNTNVCRLRCSQFSSGQFNSVQTIMVHIMMSRCSRILRGAWAAIWVPADHGALNLICFHSLQTIHV